MGCRRGSDPALLWLWRRLVATAPIGPLAWEPPYAAGAALEKAKRQKKKKKKKKEMYYLYFHVFANLLKMIFLFFFFVFFFLLFLGPLPRHMEVPRRGVQSEP